MSPRAAKVLGAFLVLLGVPLFMYLGPLGLVVWAIGSIAICESLKAIELLPPKSPSQGEEV